MKLLNYYKKKELFTNKTIFEYFIDTLKDSIFTWDYFVDYKKVIKNINYYKNEISKLNSLIGKEKSLLESELIILIKKYPKVRKLLPLLIAVRYSKFVNMPIICDIDKLTPENQLDLFNPRIPLTPALKNSLKLFIDKTGLSHFLSSSKIRNLRDYCIGIEVGMDTNARKNRTGFLMENIVEEYIKTYIEKHGGKYIQQAKKTDIKSKWNIELDVDKTNRRLDFAILSKTKKLYLIEVNYYSGGGSKLKATAGEYKTLNRLFNEQNFNFIWITDGKGWLTAKTALNETFINNDYVLNLNMLKEGILEEIIV